MGKKDGKGSGKWLFRVLIISTGRVSKGNDTKQKGAGRVDL